MNRAERRDGSGSILAEYYACGQANPAGKQLYTRDHVNSVREMIDSSSSSLIAQYDYQPFGSVSKIVETTPSDFGFAGYYHHTFSDLSLPVNRALNTNLGRWINRDPIGESSDDNLFLYVENKPTLFTDPSGLQQTPSQEHTLQSNCFGYSSGENRSTLYPLGKVQQPGPNDTYQKFFTDNKWHCNEQTKASPPCEKRCNGQKCNIVYLFEDFGYHDKGKPTMNQTPNDGVSFHTIGYQVDDTPTSCAKQGWSYILPGGQNQPVMCIDAPMTWKVPSPNFSVWCCCKSRWN